jgi:hypothetical protein
MGRMIRRHGAVGTILWLTAVGLLFAAMGCGQEPPAEQGGSGTSQRSGATSANPESTAETTGEAMTTDTAGDDSEFSDVVASYSVAQEEVEAGGEKVVGDYRVGYIVEDAEGWWEGEAQDLEWREPAASETNHIEILPYDKESGLLIPYMDIDLTVLDNSGNEVARQNLNFYWSEFLHYANNFSVPEGGTYTLRAELGPPYFPRHGSEDGEGKVFDEPVTVEFENVEINTEEG